MNSYFKISDEVQSAIAHQKPLVALESSVFAQGLPFPTNREVADAMSDAVREFGCQPVVIHLWEGKLCFGASSDDFDRMCGEQRKSYSKVGVGDIPAVLASGRPGATTVSATLKAADLLGIQVFATGGIGGVHRGWSQVPDLSADLMQLANSRCSTVCSGVKNVLDVPATQEILETLAIPVVKYATDCFPEFYCAGQPTPNWTRVDSPAQVAATITASRELIQRGVLICQPCPAEAQLPQAEVEHWVQQGLVECPSGGKGVTPYLLSYLAQASAGRTLAANCALLIQNARLAAQICSVAKTQA